MPSIHRDPRFPKGVWYCSFSTAEGKRVLRSTGTRSKGEARIICEAWAEAERARGAGSLSTSRVTQILNETLARCGQAPIRRPRLGEWLSQWLATKSNLSPKGQKCYASAVRLFCDALGNGAEHRFLDSITEADIGSFTAYLARDGRCPTTVNRIRNDLAGAFNRAVKLGLLRLNPIAATQPLADQDKIPARQTFTALEVVRLIAQAPSSDWRGAILFGYTTGARLADVANLRWSSLDLENRLVVFHARKTARRTARQTIVGLHPDFESWLLERPAPDDPASSVFPSLANRPGSGKSGLSAQFSAILTRAAISTELVRQRHGKAGRSRRSLSFHSLRHTAASAVFNGAAVREITRRVTDHSRDGGSLEGYLHADPEAIRAATALIPRLPPQL